MRELCAISSTTTICPDKLNHYFAALPNKFFAQIFKLSRFLRSKMLFFRRELTPIFSTESTPKSFINLLFLVFA